MAFMTHRTTFALDQETIARIKQLAAVWQLSQAAVVRRAVALAAESLGRDSNPASALQRLHEAGHCLARERAEDYIAEIADDRRHWRDEG